jgi:quinol monooxygenase YgiN
VIIVSGRLIVAPGARDEFVAASRESVSAARAADGCRDFVVAADPLEPDRVNVYEEWDSERELMAFRGDGPAPAMGALIVSSAVFRHQVSSSGPA